MVTMEDAYKTAKMNIGDGMKISAVREGKTIFAFERVTEKGNPLLDGRVLVVYKKDGNFEWVWVHPNSKHWELLFNTHVVELPKD